MDRDAAIRQAAAKQWHARGLLDDAALRTILAEEHGGPSAAARPGAGVQEGAWGQDILTALAGILVAAAMVTFVALSDLDNTVGAWLLWGAGMAGIGVGAVVVVWDRHRLAPAVTMAGLAAALVGAFFVEGDGWERTSELPTLLASLGAAAAAWWVLWRRWPDTPTIPVAVGAYVMVLAMAMLAAMAVIPDGREGTLVWAGIAVPWAAGTWAGSVMTRRPWAPIAVALAPITLAIGILPALFEHTDLSNGGIELVLGAVELGVLAAALRLGARPAIVTSALVIAIDAIVFAFEVGGMLLGIMVLLGTAGVLLWQAQALRRMWR